MLLSLNSTRDMSPDQPQLEHPSRTHAVLLLSLGEIDFDCPHVDARADEQPLYYDEEPLSVWTLTESNRQRVELDALLNFSGSEIEPWPVLDREIHLSNMLKRDDTSLNILDLYFLTLHDAVQRVPADTAAPETLRICCTRDLLALDARLPDGSPLRPHFADLRGCAAPLATKLAEDDLVFPIFDRCGGTAPTDTHRAFLRRHAVDAQMRALLKTVRAPEESFINRRLCA